MKIDRPKLLKAICNHWDHIPWHVRLRLRFLLLYRHWQRQPAQPPGPPPKVILTPDGIQPNIEAFAKYYINKKWPAPPRQPTRSQLRFFSLYAFTTFALLVALPPQPINIFIAPMGAFAISLILHALALTI